MTSASTSRRHLSLWLRRLSTDRIARRSPAPADAQPLAMIAQVGAARRVAAMNDAAARLGLRPFLGLADAQAMYPGLAILPHDPAADAALLAAVADWCEGFTPLVALDAPDGLLLDITGCAHLFGGEAALRDGLLRRLVAQGFRARAAIASTVGCAWAMARHGRQAIVAPGEEAAVLAPLPLVALRLAPETVAALATAGLKTVGDLMARPRAPLAARYGEGLIRRLDQALGRQDEPISPRRPVPEHMAERRFAEPISLEAHVLQVIAALGDRLGHGLEAEGLGARKLEASLFRVDGAVRRIVVGTSLPLRRGEAMQRLFIDRLAGAGEDWDAGFGFDLIRLAALETAPLAPRQAGLDARDHKAAFAALLDHLAARLGPAQVQRLEPRDTHIPERAMALVPALDQNTPRPAFPLEQDSLAPPRPLRLLDRPEAIEALAVVPDGPPSSFRWRRVSYQVARAEGPERIAMEWWRPGGQDLPTRDYFRVETAEGLRLWLFRAGLYDREPGQPAWYLHGFFP
ncbi:DNA polymerase Y family protein [Oleomonas cavernae]|uniref:DNA polymerase Y family protein n=1 Tax=Oleomonas cavernae TaxID=2320859 RepID=A0A418WBI0_9PROT|nr:DNA polymerase Y family protein [Oleomonas cavernae]RJF87372.1 DNA polymerase Y family protein [Oleomonas cavernae]